MSPSAGWPKRGASSGRAAATASAWSVRRRVTSVAIAASASAAASRSRATPSRSWKGRWAAWSTAWPRTTHAPRRAACWASSSSSLVLPPPESACTSASPPRPWPACSSSAVSIANSAWRPTKAGSVRVWRRSRWPMTTRGSVTPDATAAAISSRSAMAAPADW